MLGQFRIRSAEHKRADDFFAQQLRIHQFHGTRQLYREFVEKWAAECAAHAGNFLQLRQSKVRFREILMGHFAQPFFAEQAEMHGGGQRAERLVGADIGSGLFTADMLFASGQR